MTQKLINRFQLSIIIDLIIFVNLISSQNHQSQITATTTTTTDLNNRDSLQTTTTTTINLSTNQTEIKPSDFQIFLEPHEISQNNQSNNYVADAATDDGSTETEGNEEIFEQIHIESPSLRQAFGKQIGLPSNPLGLLISRSPCTCKSGLCACCTGMLISAFRSKGCMNLKYIPEEFAFEFKMKFNDAVLYKNKITGRNPPPICVRPPRFPFIQVCASFYDLYFSGRNMHVCLEMGGYFQGFEIFNRSFDCMAIGDKGVKIVKPSDTSILPQTAGGSSDDGNDDDDEDIDDYDENVVRSYF